MKLVKRDYIVKTCHCNEREIVGSCPIPQSTPPLTTSSLTTSSHSTKTTRLFDRTNPNVRNGLVSKLSEFYLVKDNSCVTHAWDSKQGSKEFTRLLTEMADVLRPSSRASASASVELSPAPILLSHATPLTDDLQRFFNTSRNIDTHNEHLFGVVHSLASQHPPHPPVAPMIAPMIAPMMAPMMAPLMSPIMAPQYPQYPQIDHDPSRARDVLADDNGDFSDISLTGSDILRLESDAHHRPTPNSQATNPSIPPTISTRTSDNSSGHSAGHSAFTPIQPHTTSHCVRPITSFKELNDKCELVKTLVDQRKMILTRIAKVNRDSAVYLADISAKHAQSMKELAERHVGSEKKEEWVWL